MQKITGPRMNHLKVQDSGTHMEKYVSDGRWEEKEESLGREGGERGRKKKGTEGRRKAGRGGRKAGEREKEGGGEGE